MSTRKRKASPAAQAARTRLEAIAPEAAAALGDAFTVEDVQVATLHALEAAADTPPSLVPMNVRIPSTLKTCASDAARARGVTLQAFVAEALENFLEQTN